MDDILVSGATASEHLQTFVLSSNACRIRVFIAAWRSVLLLNCQLSTLGSRQGIAIGSKVDAVKMMPPPEMVSGLHVVLGSVQFYGRFLPNLASVTEPLHHLTKEEVPWNWGIEEQAAFQKLKDLFFVDTILVHFDPSLPIGISCDASEVGLGAILFHRYSDGSERPIANASKTLTSTQRGYSQIQKEALAIIFALNKFHQFLYGCTFILVTDHKSLIALFGPTKATPALSANRLAWWALMLSQYNYSIDYRKMSDHGNARCP